MRKNVTPGTSTLFVRGPDATIDRVHEAFAGQPGEVVSMDGFAGYRSATKDALPQARAVMDPFQVVHFAADKLAVCRQRIQQVTLGHRGRSGDPLYGIKRVLRTRERLRTDKHEARLGAVFADEEHIDVEVTEHVYQEPVAAYTDPDKRTGKFAMYKVLKRIKFVVPKEFAELAQLGRSLWKRRRFWRTSFAGASNGSVEAINGRLEYLRGIALRFRNLKHFVLRPLIH